MMPSALARRAAQLVAILAIALLVGCQQTTPPVSPEATAPPDLAFDPEELARRLLDDESPAPSDLDLSATSIGSSSGPYTLAAAWGDAFGVEGALDTPRGIAVDADGYVYVANSTKDDVVRFAPDGSFDRTIGASGTGGGQLRAPWGLTIGPDGYLYVAETTNHRISVFTSAGTFVRHIGGFGTGPGQFRSPRGLAVDGSGNVFVADTSNHRVQRIPADGGAPNIYGVQGTDPGEFRSPYDVAVGLDGTVYVADTGNARVQALLPGEETFGVTWTGIAGCATCAVWALAIAADGTFYALQSSRVVARDAAAGEETVFTFSGTAGGTLNSGYGLALSDVPSRLYVTESSTHRARAIDPATSETVFSVQTPYRQPGNLYRPHDVVADPDGGWLVVETSNHRVQAFDHLGDHRATLGGDGPGTNGFGSALGQFWSPRRASFGANGHVSVLEAGSSQRVTVFDASSQPVRAWSSQVAALGSNSGRGIAALPDGDVLIADQSANVLKRFDPDGTYLGTFGMLEPGTPPLSNPYDLVADASGNVYVADRNNHRVVRFDADGAGAPLPIGGLSFPHALAVDAHGHVFIVDWSNRRVRKYRLDGALLATISAPGSTIDRYTSAWGIDVATDGAVAVVDYLGHRADVYTFTPQAHTISLSSVSDVVHASGSALVSASVPSVGGVSFAADGACALVDSGPAPGSTTTYQATLSLTGLGTCSLSASSPGDGHYAPAPDVSVSFEVLPTPQAITFTSAAPSGLEVFDTHTVTADGGASGQPVLFSTLTPAVCTVEGTKVSLVGTGTCTIAADQAGDTTHAPAPQATQSFEVGKAAASVSIEGLSATYDGSAKPVITSTDPPGLAVDLLYDDASPAPIGAGTYQVSATIDDDRYQGSASAALVIARATATLALQGLGAEYDGTPRVVTGTATGADDADLGPLAITYDGSEQAPSEPGEYAVVGSFAGDANHEPGSVTGTLVVTRMTEPQSIDFPELADAVFGDPPRTLSASATSGLPVSYDAAGTCSVSGGQLQFDGAGTCGVTASQGGNEAFDPAEPVTRSFAIARAPQVITLALPEDTDPVAFDTLTLVVAGGASGNPIEVVSDTPAVCTLDGVAVTLERGGTCTLHADQTGTLDYEDAPRASLTFAVAKAPATVLLDDLSAVYDGTVKGVSVSTEPAGLAVIIVYDPSEPLAAGTYAVSASIDDERYQGAASGDLIIAPATQAITVTSPDNDPVTLGTRSAWAAAGGGSGSPVVASSRTPAVCAIDADTVLSLAVGACTVAFDQAGDANHEAAPQVTVGFDVVFGFEGYERPVVNPPAVNAAQAGRAVPLKWRLFRADGSPVDDLASASIRSWRVACEGGAALDEIEVDEYAAGGSGLLNLGEGAYQLNWSTPRSYARACRAVSVVLGDGSVHEALFAFR